MFVHGIWKRICVQDFLLILNPIPSSGGGGGGGNFDDGSSETIVTKLGGQVGTHICYDSLHSLRTGGRWSLSLA